VGSLRGRFVELTLPVGDTDIDDIVGEAPIFISMTVCLTLSFHNGEREIRTRQVRLVPLREHSDIVAVIS
jgi:hypothetical protein